MKKNYQRHLYYSTKLPYVADHVVANFIFRPTQGDRLDFTVPEVAPFAENQVLDAGRTYGCRDRSVPGRLQESFPVQL